MLFHSINGSITHPPINIHSLIIVRFLARTCQAGAGVAVPVVAAVAVGRTGAGAARVGDVAARLHVDLPRLRQTESSAHTQTLQEHTQTQTGTTDSRGKTQFVELRQRWKYK